jgi:hypothetical protein
MLWYYNYCRTDNMRPKTPTAKTTQQFYMNSLSNMLLLFKFTLLKYISIDESLIHMNRNMHDLEDEFIYNQNILH